MIQYVDYFNKGSSDYSDFVKVISVSTVEVNCEPETDVGTSICSGPVFQHY